MEGVPACGCVVGTGWSLRALPTQTSQWFYELPIWHEGEEDCHTSPLVCQKCFTKLLHQAPLFVQLQITAAEHPFRESPTFFQKQTKICSYFTGLRWKDISSSSFQGQCTISRGERYSRPVGKILKTCLATLIRAGISMLSNESTCSDGPICFPREKRPWFSKPSSNSPPCTLPDESHLCSVYGWIFCTVMSESRTPSSTPICRMNIPFCRSVSWLTFTSRIISTRLFFLGSRENVDSTDLQSFYLAAWVQGRFLVSLQDVSDLNTEPENGTVGRDASMTFTGNRSSESQPSKTTGKHKHIPQNFWRLQF